MKLRQRLKPRNISSKKPGRRLAVITIAILLLVGLGVYFVHYLHSPAEGSIAKTATIEAPISDSSAYTSLASDYVSLLYPSEFSQDYHQTVAGTLEYKYFTIQPGPNQKAASLEVYVKPAPNGGITLDGDYKQYVADSKNYKASNKPVGGDTVDMFSKDSGGQERITLWLHGRYLLTVKLQGAVADNSIDQEIKTITNSVRWMQQ